MHSVSFRLFVFILFFCPLAFGTVEPWSLTVMELLAPLALLFLLLSCNSRQKWYTVPGLLPLVCFLSFLALQTVPLPALLIKVLSPAAHRVYKPVIDLAGGNIFLPLSINVNATVAEFFRFFAYGCFYILTVQLLSEYSRLRRTLLLVLGLAGTISFFAILQKFTAENLIFWFRPAPGNVIPTGPWIYRNHFAGFIEMLLPLHLALFLHYRPRIHYEMSWREKILSIFNLPHANLHILLGFSCLLMVVSLFVSLSRGGIISASIALIFLVLFLSGLGLLQRKMIFAMAAGLSVVLAVAWFGWQPILNRFGNILNAGVIFDPRFLIWKDSLPIIRDFPLFGAGFGTYVHLFPRYRNFFTDHSLPDHAHNDYIELLTDGGIIGLLLAGWFLFAIFRAAWQRIRIRQDSFSLLIFYGVCCGIIALLLHSVTDFNMHNGANGLYFFFLCGLLVSTATTRRYGRTRKTYLDHQPAPLIRLGTPVALICVGALLFNLGQAKAHIHFRPLADTYLNHRIPPDRLIAWRQQITQAMTAAPLDAEYPFARAGIESFLNNFDNARTYYIKALRLNPTNADYLLRTGLYLESINPEAGQMLLTASINSNPHNAQAYKAQAARLLQTGRIVEGLAQLRNALALEPDRLPEFIAITQIYNLDISAIEQILPHRVQPYLFFASYLAELNDIEMAGHYYRQAMLQLDREKEILPVFFLTPYNFFVKNKQYEQALAFLRQGIEYLPEQAELRLRAGDVYHKLGIDYRAEEEYRQALAINPKNREASDWLRKKGNQTTAEFE